MWPAANSAAGARPLAREHREEQEEQRADDPRQPAVERDERVGVLAEIREALLHCAVYAGVPAAELLQSMVAEAEEAIDRLIGARR